MIARFSSLVLVLAHQHVHHASNNDVTASVDNQKRHWILETVLDPVRNHLLTIWPVQTSCLENRLLGDKVLKHVVDQTVLVSQRSQFQAQVWVIRNACKRRSVYQFTIRWLGKNSWVYFLPIPTWYKFWFDSRVGIPVTLTFLAWG